MEPGCCDEKGGETLIFTCCGAAYSGQVSNQAGVSLMQAGAGLKVDLHVDVTELGVAKKPVEPALITDAKRVVEHVKASLLQVE